MSRYLFASDAGGTMTDVIIVDEQGLKMSKSGTNAISVIDQLSKRGADILRLWIASQMEE